MNSYSQNDEDLFILDLYKKKKIQNCFFFEFCAWDGKHLSNCRLLFENGWSGCFVELDRKKFQDLENNYKENLLFKIGLSFFIVLLEMESLEVITASFRHE